jgi:adenylate kinase
MKQDEGGAVPQNVFESRSGAGRPRQRRSPTTGSASFRNTRFAIIVTSPKKRRFSNEDSSGQAWRRICCRIVLACKVGDHQDVLKRLTFASILLSAVSGWAAPPGKPLVLILIGAPGSGKNTQSAFLQKEYGLPIISADQLVKANPNAVAGIQTLGTAPIDPRQDMIMNQLVEAKLKTIDTSKGFILDGYPATKTQADFLANLVRQGQLPAPLVLQLDVPDSVAKKRLAKSTNSDDQGQMLDQAIADYHREMGFIQLYYPNANIKQVNGNQKPAKVSQDIQAIVAAIQ